MQHNMQTENGEVVRVISPGTWNLSAGPDFKGATMLVGGSLVSGDVEIHRVSSDWHRHGHDSDANYGNVVLHAVWIDDVPVQNGTMQTVVLSKYLQSDWEHFLWELEDACYPYSRQVASGECALRWALTDDSCVCVLLKSAGVARFASKGSAMMREAVSQGVEQTLYEMMFESLGYKNNRIQFRTLARNVPLEQLLCLESDEKRRALLFGMAGLLPDMTLEEVRPECRQEVASLWDAWWSMGLRPSKKTTWNLAGMRPYNSPFRRLMAGYEMLCACNFTPAAWLRSLSHKCTTTKELLTCFSALNKSDSPWRPYRDFGHTIKPAADLLGQSRLLDMVANVLLPYLAGLSELEAGADSPGVELAKKLYLELPRLQENRLIKEAVQRFLIPPSREVDLVKYACQQQGLLNIYSTFCLALDNNCELCPLKQ
ncbi:MAG: DUF2851 family protein [Victivallales bacterium]|nr:DUF2851 family protein [Victivallales bacterium]